MSEFSSYGLIEQPNSGSRSGYQTTYVFSGIGRGIASKALASLRTGGLFSLFRGENILFSSCSIAINGRIETLNIVTGPLSFSGGTESGEEDYAEFVLETNRIEKAIETHKNYKVCWNKDLFFAVPSNGKQQTIPAVPDWYWEDRAVPTGDIKWKAAADYPADVVIGGVPHRYVLIAHRTKEGIEVYQIDAPIVTENKHFSSLSSAKKNLKKSNKLLAPKECFIYSSEDKCWLVHPDGITEENGDYVTHNVYQYADEWDQEIYEMA